MKKEFIYLVQGQSDLVCNFFRLNDRENCDLLILTYDKEVEGCIYYPNSTWAEGRNYLLQQAIEKGDYRYYIFCDDDIVFKEGGYDEFEQGLIKYKPAIGIPIVTMLLDTRISSLRNFPQTFFGNDEPLMAFHRDVVCQRLVLPYQTRFDKLSWWGSCLAQQLVIQTFYRFSILQFNNVLVDNTAHGRYEVGGYGARIYPNIVRAWFLSQLNGFYKDTCRNKAAIRTFLFSLVTLFRCKVKKNWLINDSVLSRKLSSQAKLGKLEE